MQTNTQFDTLVAMLGSEEKARVAMAAVAPVEPEVDSRVAELVKAGFKEDEAIAALAAGDAAEAPAAEAEKPAPKTSKEKAEALVDKQGYGFTSGRVYANGAVAEAIVRVLRKGKPEIVQTSGVGRTKAVLVWREDSGDVAVQNLSKSEG